MGEGAEQPTDDRRPPAAPSDGRRETIDFWRGFILCTIFINHVPGNLFERLTFRNYGFSDSSEAFVFISGLSMALAYGRRFVPGGRAAVIASLAKRAVRLYGLHIALSLAGLGIFATGAALTENADLMQMHGRDLAVDDPVAALIGLFSLGHQFGYFNILPMYVVLVGMAPVLFWLARFSLPLMLAVSFAVYAGSRLTGLNVPSWPMRGSWFFDPFTWQFLMALGMAAGVRLRTGVRFDDRLVAAAMVVVAGAAFCATDGLSAWPGLNEAVRPFADLDKTTLGMGRIAHFLSLACCVHAAGAARLMRATAWYGPLCLIGRNGLLMFALLSLLAAAGQVVTETFGHGPAIDVCVIGGGLAVLYTSARLAAGKRWRVQPGLARADLKRPSAMLHSRHR